MNNQIKFTAEMLFKKYNAIALTTEQLSEVIPRSTVSLRRDRSAKVGIPYSRFSAAKSGATVAMYNIYDIAEFLFKNKTQVA